MAAGLARLLLLVAAGSVGWRARNAHTEDRVGDGDAQLVGSAAFGLGVIGQGFRSLTDAAVVKLPAAC